MAEGSEIIGSAISSDEEEDVVNSPEGAREEDLPSPDDLTEKSAASDTEPSEKGDSPEDAEVGDVDREVPEEKDITRSELGAQEAREPHTPSDTPPVDDDSVQLDYTEEQEPKVEKEKSEENKPDLSEGEISDCEEGEILDDSPEPPPVKGKAKSKEREEGELEEGEITDSSDDEAPPPVVQRENRRPMRGGRVEGRMEYSARSRMVPPPRNHIPARMPARAPLPKRDESAWEKGLREAREMMRRATAKKQEPDFESKRMTLAPSEEARPISDDEDSVVSGRSRDEGSSSRRIPSLLDIRCSPPPPSRKVREREMREKYKGYEVPKDFDTTRIDRILAKERAMAAQKESRKHSDSPPNRRHSGTFVCSPRPRRRSPMRRRSRTRSPPMFGSERKERDVRRRRRYRSDSSERSFEKRRRLRSRSPPPRPSGYVVPLGLRSRSRSLSLSTASLLEKSEVGEEDDEEKEKEEVVEGVDLGPQCIYPAGRPPSKRTGRGPPAPPPVHVRGAMASTRSLSPPQRPGPDPISDDSSASPEREREVRRPVMNARRPNLDEGPKDPWVRRKRTESSGKFNRRSSSRSSRSSMSRSRSSSRSRQSSAAARERSPPTGDITGYRIPKKRMMQNANMYRNPKGRDEHFVDRRQPSNGGNMRGRPHNKNAHVQRGGARRPPSRTPPPPDLEPKGAEAISDDESSASSRSRSSSSSQSSSSRSSSSSSSVTGTSRSRSSATSSAPAKSRSNSPALPAKYRIANSDISADTAVVNNTVDDKNRAKGRKRPLSKSKSPSPPPPQHNVKRGRGRPRTPSESPPPPPREHTPPPPSDERKDRERRRHTSPHPAAPAEENRRERERGEREREREREQGDRRPRQQRGDIRPVPNRQKTKEELLEELRMVEEQLMKKRRAAAI